MINFTINTLPKVTEKVNLLNALENIQIATKILKDIDEDSSDLNLLDENYKKLNSELEHLKKGSDKYGTIANYL